MHLYIYYEVLNIYGINKAIVENLPGKNIFREKSILEPSLCFGNVTIFNISQDLHFDLYLVYCTYTIVGFFSFI